MRPVLRIPAYRRLLAAYALNELAFMIGSVALALLVYRHTGSALGTTAFFLSAQFIPALISPMAVRATRPTPRTRRAARAALVRGGDIRRSGLGGQRPLLGRRGAVAGLPGRSGGARGAGADADRDGVGHLGCRSPARRQRGLERRLLGVLHVRPRPGGHAGRGRRRQPRAAGQCRHLRPVRVQPPHRPGPARAGAEPRPGQGAGARGARLCPGAAVYQRIAAPASRRRAVLRDFSSGRGRVRTAFAARRRGGLRRDGLRVGAARWPERPSTPGGASVPPGS